MTPRFFPLLALVLWSTSALAQSVHSSSDAEREVPAPVYGTATVPSGRLVALEPTRARGDGELAWTLTFDEANTEGVASARAVAPAADGDVCALSQETTAATSSGFVVTRYDAGGNERWSHAIQERGYFEEVVAVGSDCVLAGGVRTEIGTNVTATRLVRVGADGVVWARLVDGPSDSQPDWYVAQPRLEAGGNGGVWMAIGQPRYDALIVRLDADGAEVARFIRPRASDFPAAGVRAVQALSDGRAVVVGGGDLFAVVASDGSLSTVPEADAFLPTAIAIAESEDAVYIQGVTTAAPAQATVRRYRLDGTEEWAVVLGETALDPFSVNITSPYTIALVSGAPAVAWQAQGGTRVTLLDAETGAEAWTTALANTFAPRGLVAIGGSLAVAADETTSGSLLARLDGTGETAWVRSEPFRAFVPARTFVRCGDDAVCLLGTGQAAGPENAHLLAVAMEGTEQWTRRRAGTPAASYGYVDAALAPDGGLYLYGGTTTETGGRDLLVTRVAPDGAVAWSVAVDGGGTSDQPGYPVGIDVAANGDVAVIGDSWTQGGTTRALAARIAADGSLRWTAAFSPASDLPNYTAAVIAGEDGGAVFASRAIAPSGNDLASITRVDEAGALDWTTQLADPALPVGLERVPGGYALASTRLPGVDAIQVDRFAPDGSLLRSDANAGVGGCEVIAGFRARAGSDAEGAVWVVAQQSNGPSSCARPTLFQFEPSGSVLSTYFDGSANFGPLALDVRRDGAAVALFDAEGGSGLATTTDAGVVETQAAPAVPGVFLGDVAIGPVTGAFGAGYRVEVEGSVPVAIATTPDEGVERMDLPALEGLDVAYGYTALLTEDGTAYAAYAGTAYGVRAFRVARVNGALPVGVNAEEPSASLLLTALGPNPIRAGASLRLTLGAPAALTLYDLLGRRVATWTDVPPGAFAAPLPATLPAGLYVLRAEGEDASTTARVTVVR